MTGVRGALLLSFALIGGCAGPSLLLLPSEQGEASGAVAVLETNGTPRNVVVDQPNSRTSLAGRPRTRAIDPARLSAAERASLDALPPAPATYILYFVEGSTRLVPSSQAQLDAMLADVARRPGAEAEVTGHTDTLGQLEDNDRLSMQRAREIADLLIAQGLAADIVSVVGRGERDPREATGDGVRNRANRRVEITVR